MWIPQSSFPEDDAGRHMAHSGDDQEWMRSVALIGSLACAYGAAIKDIIAFSREVDTRFA
jgi:hypothetical protein